MPKTKSRRNGTQDTKESRLVAAGSFTRGDRVRHKITGRIGEFDSINLGFALPEVWVEFESKSEIRVPVSCNPLDLELVRNRSPEHQVLTELGMLWNTELANQPNASSVAQSPNSFFPEASENIMAHPDSVFATAVEVVEELTESELAERHRLELKVERAFFEAGCALRELRDRRLYRATHRSFEEYCRDRFEFGRAHSYRLIDAAIVVENLWSNDTHNDLSPIRRQILPTKLEQVRPLTALEPDEQRQIWEEAVEATGGKVPSGRIVKSIVERLKERGTTPPPIPYSKGDVVMIRGMGNSDIRKFDGRWAIALQINEYTVTLALDGKDVAVKPQFLEPVDPKYWVEMKAVQERMTRLQNSCDLDPDEDAVLEVLRRRTCFTSKQMTLLERMENDYGVV